jgi:hypothetical protein
MTRSLDAIFDGEVLRLEKPLELRPNTRVRITLEVDEPEQDAEPYSFLRTAQALELDGPADWSERVDDYLYGYGKD